LINFKALLDGAGDEYPESAFYMMGTLEESLEKGRSIN
jgi:F-type H+-transporting ATPase subunit beta